VRPYFGDGDECHMAFHFPLMPRMFMALRREDRHAITEIMAQTPEIPDNCQWALFLRNHDELTLEMVTDEERDYMYQSYAADPQMRLNLGIRRRLAPLVENSRRRMELLNTLLFSLPGTPIIYYGDEIGMGDNIYLGDRNGVRTPMQWTGDRNGGFSRADMARLFAPPIMDPVYGFQSINVEAQERYPFSLLNWMKRLISMRKQHRVFGRGSLEFVGCSNRKVIAFLRRDEQETILVVANLSRTVQPAELDLTAFAGLYPIEMVGLTEFPRIGDRPYFLSLGQHASYWFTLQTSPSGVTQLAPRAPGSEPQPLAETLPSLLVGNDWEGVLDRATRQVLERQGLQAFLKRQRWFGGKSRELREARFSDWATIRAGQTPAFMATVSVLYADGGRDNYQVPLATMTGDQAGRVLSETPSAVLARITGARKGIIVDGPLDDDTCSRLVTAIEQGRHLVTAKGALRGSLLGERLAIGPEARWTRGSGDQSNSLAFVNDRFVLKLFRRIEPGPNPEFEIARVLARRGFTRTPALVGALEYDRTALEPSVIALVQDLVHHQGSGWDFIIDELGRYYERVAARGVEHDATLSIGRRPDGSRLPPWRSNTAAETSGESQPTPFFMSLEGYYMAAAAMFGRRTAELHLALADDSDPAFAPERLGPSELQALGESMRLHAAGVLDLLGRRLATLPETVQPRAETLLAARSELLARFERVSALEDAGARIRIHGDYHLGQILRTEEDIMILDFEGEPARSLAERRAKQSPLKDVAGMLRSFSYAAYAALFAFTVRSSADYPVLESWGDEWEHWVSSAFCAEYLATMAPSGLLPGDGSLDPLLQALVLDKALYELGYELNNRPDWVRIPLIGLLKLL
jgi:maltose alpha-D-glucosyltransferase/alpha-amylase